MGSLQINSSTIKVVMLPWLAHGHITPFLELAKKLATRNFHIYLCSTPINLSFIKSRMEQYSIFSSNITLVEFELPSSPELPPHYHTTTGLPHHLFPTLNKVFRASASESFSNILKTLTPDLVFYDLHQPWAPTISSSYNVPAVQFLTSGASIVSLSIHSSRPFSSTFPFPEIQHEGFYGSNIHDKFMSPDDEERGLVYEALEASSRIILINSFRELEDKYINYLPSLVGNKKVVPVGPLVKNDVIDDGVEDTHRIMKWLGEKEESSTVLVAFGSEFYLSKQEIEEVAHGLELSKVNFIWVLRFPIGEEMSIQEALPNGFLERVTGRGKGLVVENWAPQSKILAHPNTGGFVSHCGWNSTMESLKFGVPIIAIPMLYDQPFNARLLEDVGLGFEVKRIKEDGSFKGEDISKLIRKVIVEKDGEGTRMRARKLSEKIKMKGDEEMDELVQELVQLCKDSKLNEI